MLERGSHMRCLIITPYFEGSPSDISSLGAFDLVLCADSSQGLADLAGISPHFVIGDFDHGDVAVPAGENVIRVPSEKDDTDTMLCIKRAIESGARELLILGGIGGRLDHTIANLQSLAYAHEQGAHAVIFDGKNEAMILSGSAEFPRRVGWYLSVFAYGGVCRGVCEQGVKYPIECATLTPNFPLGVSNEIVADTARIEVREGRLLVVFSRKESTN